MVYACSMTTESVRYERRGSQNMNLYAAFHRVSGRRLGNVNKSLDGSWSADRATGPSRDLVSARGLKSRREAGEALC